jgi:tetratricopeptide (TPR) repeat protein
MSGIAGHGVPWTVVAPGPERLRRAVAERPGPGRRRSRGGLLAILLFLSAVPGAAAGGGPETTLVVVNARSALSRRIANEYVALRDIPLTNVLWLYSVPHQGIISLDEFRSAILDPLDRFLGAEGLSDSIDLVAYSSGFPYGVDFRSLLPPGDPGFVTGGIASLTGLTFLAEDVKAGRPFWSLLANRYFRFVGGQGAPPTPEQTAAFDAAVAAARAGRLEEAERLFEEALAAEPGIAAGWYLRACCLARLGRAADALAALRRALEEGFANPDRAAGDPDLACLRDHEEFRRILRMMAPGYLPAHGFRCTQAWSREAEPSDGPGRRYRLAVHLAHTGPRGNSLPEVLACLGSAAASDGTRPDGTVYLCRNGDVRSRAREPFFPPVIEALKKLGRRVEVLEAGQEGQTGILPMGKPDVLGAVVGIPEFDFGASGSRVLPGAILEHLTSFGGVMAPSGQTNLTEFLRHGAAGSSGTVMEPLSIHLKFPNPMLHAHYAEGCSLAEAFYQNVGSPYQLMVAGDGLARPFAKFPEVDVVAPNSPWRGTVRIAARAPDSDTELWVDGRMAARGAEMTVDTTRLDDGWHDIRVVAVARGRIGTRAFRRLGAVIDNHGLTGSARWEPSGAPFASGTAVLRADGAREFEVLAGIRVVGRGTDGRCEVPLSAAGSGPVALVPRLLFSGGRALRLPPLRTTAEELPPEPAIVSSRLRLPGLRGRAAMGESDLPVVTALVSDTVLGPTFAARPGPVARIVLWGEFEAPEDGTWEISFGGSGRLTAEIAGRTLLEDADLSVEQYAALCVPEGWHPIWLDLRPEGVPDLRAAIVGQRPHGPVRFCHAARPRAAEQPAVEGTKAGEVLAAGEGGFVLCWSRAAEDFSALLLVPDPQADGFPTGWIVEVPDQEQGWKAIEDVEVHTGPPAGRAPSFVELSFRSLRPVRLRVRPAGGTARLLGILALGRER